jgi:hypothetical protein
VDDTLEVIPLDDDPASPTRAERLRRPPRPPRIPITPKRARLLVLLALVAVFAGTVILASAAGLWPSQSQQEAGIVRLGPAALVEARLQKSGRPLEVTASNAKRFFLVSFPPDVLTAARAVYTDEQYNSVKSGFAAFSAVDPHLREQVEWCASSGWFEEPVHDSKWTEYGDKTAGPTPRGLSLYSVQVVAGNVVVDTNTVIGGTPIGTMVVPSPARGPHCVS